MKIMVNGKEVEIEPGATLRGLIEKMGLGTSACAAEVNKEIVPRRGQDSRELREGDVVELVTLVGGG